MTGTQDPAVPCGIVAIFSKSETDPGDVSFCSKALRVQLSVLGDTVIYLDEQIATHQKMLRAGQLIGDAKGGVMMALGLYVAAIGYARSHLTNGVVPDEFLQKASRNSDAISSLRKAKLIHKLRGNRWLIHDYLKWNPSAAQVQHERELTKQRQQVFRRKSTAFPQGCNGVTEAEGERRSNATVTLDPQSPIPDPLVQIKEQRPDGRETSTIDQQQRRRTAARAPADDGNYAVLEKLAHTVLDELHTTDPESPEVVETLKVKCAQLAIDYRTDPQIVRRALVSAATQRVRAVAARVDRPFESVASIVRRVTTPSLRARR